MVRNPVMFVVEVGSVLTTGLFIQALVGRGEAPAGFIAAVALWLWFTVLFANFAEAMAEGRGKAQAEALRQTRHDDHREEAARARTRRPPQRGPVDGAAQGRRRAGRGRRLDPRRRRGDRGRRLGGRERRHRRKRAGHPRKRRRSQRGHRRHQGALRLAGRPHHGQSRRDLPRPHDRAGRGRKRQKTPNEIALNDPAGGAHHHLPARHASRCCRSRSTASRRRGRARRSRSRCWWRCSSA